MVDDPHFALLPPGFNDILFPYAQREASTVEDLMRLFDSFGYDRVKPPLIEFETSFFKGTGAGLAKQTFCLYDPLSHQSIALRSDTTVQIVRIALSRLADVPRPLRLTYAGQILRLQGEQLRPERQFGQIGCELIGSESWQADFEIITLALRALRTMGIDDVSLDLCLPLLIERLSQEYGLESGRQIRLRQALADRDPVALADHPPIFQALSAISGAAAPAIDALKQMNLPSSLTPEIERLSWISRQLLPDFPLLKLTFDPIEIQNFHYHAGLSFTFFSPQARSELGRGGRYRVESIATATGFTLYTDTILQALPSQPERPRLLIPYETPTVQAQALRDQGWRTIAALTPKIDPFAEARRLRCSHLLKEERILPVDDPNRDGRI